MDARELRSKIGTRGLMNTYTSEKEGDLMARVCDVCERECPGGRHCYLVKDNRGVTIEEKCGHRECIEVPRQKVLNKLNKNNRKVK
jgi:hypothetical protein